MELENTKHKKKVFVNFANKVLKLLLGFKSKCTGVKMTVHQSSIDAPLIGHRCTTFGP